MQTLISPNLECRMVREATAAALTAAGFPIKAKTLATMATRGGGPPYSKFGMRVLYQWNDALKWAEGRLSTPCHSTSENDVRIGHDRISNENGL